MTPIVHFGKKLSDWQNFVKYTSKLWLKVKDDTLDETENKITSLEILCKVGQVGLKT